jgi:hypothetical protein
MTVAELIHLLGQLPPDADVYLDVDYRLDKASVCTYDESLQLVRILA